MADRADSGVYFQSYKLAYDLAKRAERRFRFELGLQDSSYINFGYWDSLKRDCSLVKSFSMTCAGLKPLI